jgi:hypothetical protein
MVNEYVFGLVKFKYPTKSMSIKIGIGFTNLYPESLNLFLANIAEIDRII